MIFKYENVKKLGKGYIIWIKYGLKIKKLVLLSLNICKVLFNCIKYLYKVNINWKRYKMIFFLM